MSSFVSGLNCRSHGEEENSIPNIPISKSTGTWEGASECVLRSLCPVPSLFSFLLCLSFPLFLPLLHASSLCLLTLLPPGRAEEWRGAEVLSKLLSPQCFWRSDPVAEVTLASTGPSPEGGPSPPRVARRESKRNDLHVSILHFSFSETRAPPPVLAWGKVQRTCML